MVARWTSAAVSSVKVQSKPAPFNDNEKGKIASRPSRRCPLPRLLIISIVTLSDVLSSRCSASENNKEANGGTRFSLLPAGPGNTEFTTIALVQLVLI